MNSDIVSLIIILICVMLSAYFSATETSFTSLNRIRMKNMAEKGDKRAELVLKLLENFDKLLSTILVGNNIVNIGLSSLATVLFIKLLGGDSGATVSTIVTTIVVLIFGEVSPKSIAKESPETIAKFPHSDDHADPGDVSLFPVEEAALPHLQILGKPRHHR